MDEWTDENLQAKVTLLKQVRQKKEIKGCVWFKAPIIWQMQQTDNILIFLFFKENKKFQ